MSRPDWLTVPNGLTLGRIALTPLFGYFWWRQRYSSAIVLFAVAAASDFLDGLIARLCNQRSRVGQLLDPAADKLMVFVAMIAAAHTGAVPVWLAGMVILRDVLLAAGGAFFTFFAPGVHGPEGWRPTRVGKYATACTVSMLVLALIFDVTGRQELAPFVGVLALLCALTTTLSGFQYLSFGVAACRRSAQRRATVARATEGAVR